MKFNKKHFIIYKDMFNIYNLIKEINQGYRLYFNLKNKKFYIININNNFEICYSFDSFYSNILYDLRFSKIANINKILKEIDIFNNNLEKKTIETSKQITTDKIKEINYLSNRASITKT